MDYRDISGIGDLEPFCYVNDKPIDEYYKGWRDGILEALKAIRGLPRYDGIKTGYWKRREFINGKKSQRCTLCSVCGMETWSAPPYCPHCGSRMVSYKHLHGEECVRRD